MLTDEQRGELYEFFRAQLAVVTIADHVESMIAQARAEEREACAKVCDARAEWLHSNMHALKAEQSETLAAAIRARKDGQ